MNLIKNLLLLASFSVMTNSIPELEFSEKDIAPYLSQMLMVGLEGESIQDNGVKRLINQIHEGKVNNVILFRRNIKSSEQLRKLTKSLHKAAGEKNKLFIAVDQEGGKVQRLSSSNGFLNYMSAQKVAENKTPEEAQFYYNENLLGVRETGINLVLGPVVDLKHARNGGPLNPVIGKLERAFSEDPETITLYASAFINAFRNAKIATAVKHFPGHGLAGGDSHKGFVDITETHKEEELFPFYSLIENNNVDMIMSAHLIHKKFDLINPLSLSPTFITETLRDKGYDGVVITDDLFMGAIRQYYTFEEALISAILASNDIIILSVNSAAFKGVVNDSESDITQENLDADDFVKKSYDIVLKALSKGVLSIQDLKISSNRVKALKNKTLKKYNKAPL